jgi:PAS domain S-box-containing protein
MSNDLHRVDVPVAPGDGGGTRDATWEVLSDHINDLIILADLSGMIFYASPSCRNLGYAQSDLIGRTAVDFVHPEDLDHFTANSEALVRGSADGQPVDREHRIRRKDGSWVWMEGSPNLLPSGDGGAVGVINVFRDVSERRVDRDALSDQARRAAQAEAIAGLGYWRLDAATQKITWSEQMFHIFGLPMGDEPPLAAAMAMTHPEDIIGSGVRLSEALDGGGGWADVVTRIVRPDGQVRNLRGSAVCETNVAGGVTAVFGTVVDVTEQLEAQAAIEESERRYRLIAENTTDMISQTSCHDGRLVYLSPAVERITGFSVSEMTGARMQDHVHGEDRAAFMEAFADLLSGRAPEGRAIRFRARHKGGAWLWLESNPRLLRGPDGAPTTIIDVTRDVTEQEALKDRLRDARAEAEKLAEVKSEFLANISHEIRTPLTAVLGFTSLLAQRSNLDEVAQGFVARIAGAGRGLLAIVNDVLDFSKLDAGEVTITPRPTAAAQTAQEVLEMFEGAAETKGLKLHFEAAAEVPLLVSLDADRLRQILINLIGNAVKFTDRGGVTVSVDYEQGAGRLLIEVADTGPGIAAGAQEKLFQRFSRVDSSSTRAKGGTGLGLAICRRLADAMGGSVSLRSRPGHGSTFRVDLTAPATAAAPSGETLAPDDASLNGIRVLVVDDNAANRELARAILQSAGVEVSEARNGAESADFARRLPVDLILMDLQMPGLSGALAAQTIRRTPGPNQDIPILAFSADNEPTPHLNGGSRLFNGQISKPAAAVQLLEGLRKALADDIHPMPEMARHARG